MNSIFCTLEEAQKTRFQFFAILNKLKKHGFNLFKPLRELIIEMLFSSLKKVDFEEFGRIFYYMFRNSYCIKIGRKWLV
eukprot:UN05541